MLDWVNYLIVYLGSGLMVYNIYGFVCFARFIKKLNSWRQRNLILYIPIILLVCFLLGYLTVALFGKPDLVVAGILFGGSVFVQVIYRLLSSITQQIIESERLEAELLAAEESSREKISFLASISHEMRTPLNVILGLDTLALKNSHIQGECREQMEKIGQSARHLLELINNILDMNQLESGELIIKEEEFSLMEALGQVETISNALGQQKGLELRTRVDEGAAGRYIADATQLKRILLCILDNAVKYTDPPGTVTFSVEASPEQGEKRLVTFRVTDTGIGMDEAFLPRVFEPLTQEDASFTNRFGGSGLSLAVAKRILMRMGGDIEAESRKNQGSTFTVRLPMTVVDREEPVQAKGEALESLEGCRILIVEDMEENAEIAADLLELEGAESEHAENGKIALEMIARAPEYYYDAVLMDLRMPLMDGLEAARKIREMEREDTKCLPILALTANAFESDVQHSHEAGMDIHLVKPVDADKMYNALKQLIGQAQTEKRGKRP